MTGGGLTVIANAPIRPGRPCWADSSTAPFIPWDCFLARCCPRLWLSSRFVCFEGSADFGIRGFFCSELLNTLVTPLAAVQTVMATAGRPARPRSGRQRSRLRRAAGATGVDGGEQFRGTGIPGISSSADRSRPAFTYQLLVARSLHAFAAHPATLGLLTPVVSAQAPPSQSWDAQFRAIPEPARIGGSMKRLSARPHHLGSPYDKDNAEWIAGLLKQWGWQVAIEILPRALSDADDAPGSDARAQPVHRQARGTGRRGQFRYRRSRPSSSRLQRVLPLTATSPGAWCT